MSDADRVFELTREFDISGMIRLEMIGEPARAVAVLEHALASPRVRNRAGFAVANWKSGFDPRPAGVAPAPQPELESSPPTLAHFEHAWSLDDREIGDALARLMGAALALHGGFAILRPDDVEP